MLLQHQGKYLVGSDTALSDRQMNQLTSAFEATISHQDADEPGGLDGRSPVVRMDLDGIGPVVVKTYTRGGVIRRVIHRTYLRTGSPRCRKEYMLLNRLHRLGVRAPTPVAFACAGNLFYHAWLVSKELQDTLPMTVTGKIAPDRCRMAMRDLEPQLSILVANRILHVDLHPGNVLVDPEGRAYLIDFDKARTWRRGADRLRRRYRERWQRAIAKHGLPQLLQALPI
jgi:3-deoxy-D-manno-octulosonic acid kinase